LDIIKRHQFSSKSQPKLNPLPLIKLYNGNETSFQLKGVMPKKKRKINKTKINKGGEDEK
jgi:hypothetical protein